jgi:hypothetical protein
VEGPLKLTRLKVHRYRGVAPGCELAFGPSFNLVLGENGTGRTTLLELIAIVLGSDFSGLIREEFSLEYSFLFPGMELHASVRNVKRAAAAGPEGASLGEPALLSLRTPEAEPVFEPFIELILQLEAPASRLVMRANASGVAWEVDGQPGYSQSMQWSLLDRTVWMLLFMTTRYLEREVRERLKELLRRTFLLGPSRFDEGLGMFERIGEIRYAMEKRDGELFPLGLMALPAWLPGWLRDRVERELPVDALEIRHEEVGQGFLAKFVALAGFAAGTLRLELLERQVFENGWRLGFGRFNFRFTRQDGSVLSQAELGHGQKRLLSFLYYLDVNEDFAVADELGAGLQPRWVEACLREIGERQAFLTSQDPRVVERVSSGLAGVGQPSRILCERGLREGREWLVWSNR